MKMKHGVVLGMVLGLAAAQMALAETTALDLVKKGDNYVGIQSRDKILEVYSDKSVAGLEPNVWHVVYYDPATWMKSVDVKFGADQELEVSHPMHPFELPAKTDDILDPSKITVDSNRAVSIAQSQPILKGLTLRSSKLMLEKSDNQPVWKVELWAAKVSDHSKEASVGTVCISAIDGSVVKSDLHPSYAD